MVHWFVDEGNKCGVAKVQYNALPGSMVTFLGKVLFPSIPVSFFHPRQGDPLAFVPRICGFSPLRALVASDLHS
ncbi:hypothetical protein L210DRAFT_953084, partial [Boletus edulis BED1]